MTNIKDALETSLRIIEREFPNGQAVIDIKAALSQLTASPDREKVAAEPTEAQVASACLSYQ